MKKSERSNKFPNKSLKTLRAILGMSQERFAAEIGVSPDSIDSIEIGRMALTEKMARRIAVATGARLGKSTFFMGGKFCWKALTDGSIRSGWVNKDHPSSTYTKETFDYHRQKFQTSAKAASSELCEIVERGLKPLFDAAAKPSRIGPKYRLPALAFELWDWIYEADARFKLGADLPKD